MSGSGDSGSGAPPPRGGFGRARPVGERGPVPNPFAQPDSGSGGAPASAVPPPSPEPSAERSRWDVAPADGWGGAGAPDAAQTPPLTPTPAPAAQSDVERGLEALRDAEPAATPRPTGPAPGVRALNCPNCGGTVEMRAAGYTVSVACQYCGSVLDVTQGDAALIERHSRATADLAIPLGARGLVRGNDYQVVGYMRRSVDGEGWDEYLLFNPFVGYRWLVDEDGAWSFSTQLVRLPDTRQMPLVRYAGTTFEHDGDVWDAVVDTVVGEFYWRVQRGDRVRLANFESGNATLSREQAADEVSWSVSQPLSMAEIDGFQLFDGAAAAMPGAASRRSADTSDAMDDSYGLDQPTAFGGDGPFARAWLYTKIGGAAAALMLLVMIVFSFGGMSEQAVEYQLPLDGGERSVSFGPLTFNGGTQRVVIESSAPGINNAWIDADLRLVERRTLNTVAAYDLIERYSGYDSDGQWTEGSERTSTGLASVPAGTYDLIIDASASSWSNTPQVNSSWIGGGSGNSVVNPRAGEMITVRTSVRSGGVFFSNFVLALILLGIPPAFLIWRGLKQRKRGY